MLFGCDASRATLTLDVRTDLQPGTEFVAVRTTGDGLEPMQRTAFRTSSFLDRVRVAQWDLPPGRYSFDVDFLSSSERVVLSRPVSVELSEAGQSATIVVTRDCQGVTCPGDGPPSATACLNGRCVPPDCSIESPGECESICEADAACEGESACTDGLCVDSTCLVIVRNDQCAQGEFCHPVRGCVEDDTLVTDAGPPTAMTRVVRGEIDFAQEGALVESVELDSFEPTRTLVLLGRQTSEETLSATSVRAELASSTQLRLTRFDSPVALRVGYQVVELPEEFSVQRDTLLRPRGSTLVSETLPVEVDSAHSFVVATASGDAMEEGAPAFLHARIAGAQSLEFRVGADPEGSQSDIAWQVVSSDRIDVQHLDFVIPFGQSEAILVDAARDNAAFVATWTFEAAAVGNGRNMLVRARRVGSDVVVAREGSTGAISGTLQIIAFDPSIARVNTGELTVADSNRAGSVDLSVDPLRTMFFLSGAWEGAETDEDGVRRLGEARFTLDYSDGALTVTRAETTWTARATWFAVEFLR